MKSLYFLFWPIIGLRYLLLERVLIPAQYHEVSCTLDRFIPFQEVFLIPYVLWYAFLIGVHVYTFLYDTPSFRWYTRFLITAFSISTLVFILCPTCQNLRPAVFPRDNFLTEGVKLLYAADTNTNVCPSEHVIGSIAAFLAVRNTRSLQKPGLTVFFGILAFFTSIATVFLKQHSAVDVLAALPVCGIAFLLCRKRTIPAKKP